jgi:hypothetical protein
VKQVKPRGRPSRNLNEEPVEDQDELAAAQPKIQKYVQLVPRTRRIAQEKIDTWPQVSVQVLDEIVAVLGDAKKDIVNTTRDERRELAEERLGALVQRLARQIADSRIPPQAKDIHFNIDKLTERNAQLFREVTTQRHSKQLLEDQVKVAQHLLAKDEENLEQLKKNTAKWRAEWKRQEQRGRVGSPLFLTRLSMPLTCCSSIHCCKAWRMPKCSTMALTTLASSGPGQRMFQCSIPLIPSSHRCLSNSGAAWRACRVIMNKSRAWTRPWAMRRRHWTMCSSDTPAHSSTQHCELLEMQVWDGA